MTSYHLRGYFTCPDVKYADEATLDVELDTAPTEAEAEVLLRPVVDAKIRGYYGEDYRWDLESVSVAPA